MRITKEGIAAIEAELEETKRTIEKIRGNARSIGEQALATQLALQWCQLTLQIDAIKDTHPAFREEKSDAAAQA